MAYKRRLSGEDTPTRCCEELVPSFKRMRTTDPVAQAHEAAHEHHPGMQQTWHKHPTSPLPSCNPLAGYKAPAVGGVDQQHQQFQQHQQHPHGFPADLPAMNVVLRQLHFERLQRLAAQGHAL